MDAAPQRLTAAAGMLARAGRACSRRGAQATGLLDARTVWHLDAALVDLAAMAVADAAAHLDPAAGSPGASTSEPGVVDGDPLQLAVDAWQLLSDLPDDAVAQDAVWAAVLQAGDAVAAVRRHYV